MNVGVRVFAEPSGSVRVRIRIMLAICGALVTGWSANARAQEGRLDAGPGDSVRVTWCIVRTSDGACGQTVRAIGLLGAGDSTGLTLRRGDSTESLAWREVRRVELHAGRRGSVRTVAFAAGGLVVGALSGTFAGAGLQGDCYELGCLAGPVYGFAAGAAFGLTAGVAVALKTRDRWRTIYDATGSGW